MPKWEYQAIFFANCRNLTDELNALGAEGWELVGFSTEPEGNSCVFKRPIPVPVTLQLYHENRGIAHG